MTPKFSKNNGIAGLSLENGKLRTESIEESYVKHNLLCCARTSRHLFYDRILARGTPISLQGDVFSESWIFYENQNKDQTNASGIASELNSALDRDYLNGKIKKVIVNNISISEQGYDIIFSINKNSIKISV